MTARIDLGGYQGLMISNLDWNKDLVYHFPDHYISPKEEISSGNLINSMEIEDLINETRSLVVSKQICQDLSQFRNYFKDMKQIFDPSTSFHIDVNTSKISISENELFQGTQLLDLNNLQNTIIEQMRNTQLELTQGDIADEYAVPGADVIEQDEEFPLSQEPMMVDLSDMSGLKTENEISLFQTRSVDTSFNFWKLMEPESWQIS